ncbi:MAG TPA: hypothetical protein VLE73_02845 [Candidatus Saccharimonadales bacterium]|nr:hypothetical protein [Candidatus Saccharimonadales bacterium]
MHNPNTLRTALAFTTVIALGACSAERPQSPAETPPIVAVGPTAKGSDQSFGIRDAAKSAGKILVAAGQPNAHDIFMIDLATNAALNLTYTPPGTQPTDELNPQVSPTPNGIEVTFTSNTSGKYQIYRLPLANLGGLVQLTSSDANNDDPTWSLDGKRIYYKTSANGHGDILSVPWNGTGKPQNLTKKATATEEWKPVAVTDNLLVVTTSHGDDGTMNKRQLFATAELAIVDTTKPNDLPKELTNNDYPDWYASPKPEEPTVIAYTSRDETNPTGHDIIKQMDITRFDKPQTLVNIPGDSDDSSWAPPLPKSDGDTLLFVNNSTGTYRAMARTPSGAIVDLNLPVSGEVLSPVAVGPITIGNERKG